MRYCKKPSNFCLREQIGLTDSEGLAPYTHHLWRGSLLPLGCAAAPERLTRFCLNNRDSFIGGASRPSGSKLPRHTSSFTGDGETSDRDLGLLVGKSISSLRAPLQTQRAGVAARVNSGAKRHCPLSVDAFLSSTVRRHGGCAWDTFGYAGFLIPVREPAYSYHPIASRR